MKYCFLNGKILPLEEAKISIWDIGLLRGYGIYDGIAAFGGKPFRFADHWNRFLSGAGVLNLNVPITEEGAEKAISELLEKNGLFKRANIRMILTGGNTVAGIEYNFDEPTFYILTEKWESLLKENYTEGGKLVTYRHMRHLPECKTINYIRGVNLQNWRKEEGAVEILYTYDGDVLECATSNIFLVKDRTLITPAENVLKGITGKIVREIAGNDFEIQERIVREGELRDADEVFITSSFKDIVPIVRIDDFTVGRGSVGPVTIELMKRFANYVAKY
jgi:branched-subunit amino acid aminotransferase/4-amino-4-deoxychorismate lyase